MSEDILNDLDVHARFAHPGREGMPQGMAAETRQEYGAVRVLRQHFIVAVPDDAPDGFVQRSLMLRIPESIDKDEIRIAINRSRTADTSSHLVLSLFQKRFFDVSQHGNLPNSCFGFRRMDVAVAAVDLMLVIHKRMIDINDAFFQIPEKVIKYLWDDAFKFNPEALFDTETMESLEQVIRTFVYSRGKERFNIFKPTIRQLLYPENQ